jgi:hypothetical protein
MSVYHTKDHDLAVNPAAMGRLISYLTMAGVTMSLQQFICNADNNFGAAIVK